MNTLTTSVEEDNENSISSAKVRFDKSVNFNSDNSYAIQMKNDHNERKIARIKSKKTVSDLGCFYLLHSFAFGSIDS